MKLVSGSTTVEIISALWYCGQLPYSSLRLMSGSYEWIKDCAQRLVREKYVGLIQAKNLKCLYLTPQGQQAFTHFQKKHNPGFHEEWIPDTVYHASKAKRESRVNETRLFVATSGFHDNFLTSREFKHKLELQNPRSSDNIKYSRFTGVLHCSTKNILFYNFGKKNIH